MVDMHGTISSSPFAPGRDKVPATRAPFFYAFREWETPFLVNRYDPAIQRTRCSAPDVRATFSFSVAIAKRPRSKVQFIATTAFANNIMERPNDNYLECFDLGVVANFAEEVSGKAALEHGSLCDTGIPVLLKMTRKERLMGRIYEGKCVESFSEIWLSVNRMIAPLHYQHAFLLLPIRNKLRRVSRALLRRFTEGEA